MANTEKATSPQGGEDAVAAAPESSVKEGKGKVVRTVWPNNRFVIEDLPVITTDGTELTAAQVKVAAEAAKANNVKLIDADGKRLDVEEKK